MQNGGKPEDVRTDIDDSAIPNVIPSLSELPKRKKPWEVAKEKHDPKE